jgi:hypothetical protein
MMAVCSLIALNRTVELPAYRRFMRLLESNFHRTGFFFATRIFPRRTADQQRTDFTKRYFPESARILARSRAKKRGRAKINQRNSYRMKRAERH